MRRAIRPTKPLSLSLLLVLAISNLPAGVPEAAARAQGNAVAVQGRTLPLPVGNSRAFVNYKSDGEVGCRDATEEEASALKRRSGRPLHVISPERTRPNLSLNAESTGLQIVLRATDQLEDYPEAKAAFLNAAARWQSVISTPVTVIIDVDFGPTWFGERYDDDVLGQTDSQTLGDNSIYGEVRAALLGLTASSDLAGVINQLPVSSVPTDLGSTTYVLAPSALWRALGFINPIADPSNEQGELGDPPAVGFNSDFRYDFDPSDGINSSSIDFDAVAVHELGHVLGFDSNTGYRELARSSPVAVSVWDIFRFRPGVTLDNFATAERVLSSGGSQNYFDGSREVGLSTGRPDGTGGDREQASHWKDDRITGNHIGIMDPTLSDGVRQTITENDLAALRSFGYTVGASQVDPGAPTITSVTYTGKKLKINGTGFGGQLVVEVNGLALASSITVNVNGSARQIKIKSSRANLSLQSGLNQVQVINNGVRSNTFTFFL